MHKREKLNFVQPVFNIRLLYVHYFIFLDLRWGIRSLFFILYLEKREKQRLCVVMLPSSFSSDYSVWRFLLLSVVACRKPLNLARLGKEKIYSFVIVHNLTYLFYIHNWKGREYPKKRKLKINIEAYLINLMTVAKTYLTNMPF